MNRYVDSDFEDFFGILHKLDFFRNCPVISYKKLREKHTIKQAVKMILLRYFPNIGPGILKLIFNTSLNQMPLLINEDGVEKLIAVWRIKIGK